MVDETHIRNLLSASGFKCTGTVSINDEKEINVLGHVSLRESDISQFPPGIKFSHVAGDFIIDGNPNLQTLVGSPDRVGGSFICINNEQLVSLNGGPKSVAKSYGCGRMIRLKSLEGVPRIVAEFDCSGSLSLSSLEGCPATVNGIFSCYNLPKLKSLDHLPNTIEGDLRITWTPKLNLLRALVAKDGVWFTQNGEDDQKNPKAKKVERILNNYAGQGKMAVFDCQKDLEDSGFKENARW
jgi:hypothetical protein